MKCLYEDKCSDVGERCLSCRRYEENSYWEPIEESRGKLVKQPLPIHDYTGDDIGGGANTTENKSWSGGR